MKIYIASKVKHAQKWLDLKANGVNIISTWISKPGNLEEEEKAALQIDCINDVIKSDVVIVYREPGEHLVGAYIELGAAMVTFKSVYFVSEIDILKPTSVFSQYPRLTYCKTIEEAIQLIEGKEAKPGEQTKGETAQRLWPGYL